MAKLRHSNSKLIGFSCVLVLSGILSACGFQLRGTQVLPESLNSIKFQCANEKHWDLCRQLSREFQYHQVELSETADIVLSISAVNKKQRSVSIDSDASTAEYDLIYSLHYTLTHAPTQKVITSERVEASQSYRHQSSALIAKEREQSEIHTKLNEKITNILVRQLSVFDSPRIQKAINDK